MLQSSCVTETFLADGFEYIQGPLSQLYSHILTSCFLDTILVPLCSWLYLLAVLILFSIPFRSNYASEREYTPGVGFRQAKTRFGVRKNPDVVEVQEDVLASPVQKKRSKAQVALNAVYYLLVAAQIAMCVLEITRLSLAELGVGLLPFSIATLLVASALRFTQGFRGRVTGWRWTNVAVWSALAVTNGVKLAEEIKEGGDARKGTKYPESDRIIDVAVMIGVYIVLDVLEAVVRR